MLILLAGCTGPTTGDTGGPDSNARFAILADEHVALPYVVEGDAAPEATFTVTADGGRGSQGGATVTVTGDFAVEGDEGPFELGESRRYTVRYTGDTSAPTIATGTVSVTVERQSVELTLAAVVGDDELPDAAWTNNGRGEEAVLALPSAPYPFPGGAYDDPSVLVFVPEGLADRGDIGLATHLHGWNATLSEIVVSQRLVELTAISGRDAVLVVPQGPVEAEDGDFGRLEQPDGMANLARDVISVLYRDGFVTKPVLGQVALSAHSGGYGAAARILEDGGVPIAAVHLFDALYGEEETFAAFAESGGVLRSLYTDEGGTAEENEALADTLTGAGVTVSDDFGDYALLSNNVTIGRVGATHSGCVSNERMFGRWLTASGLAHRPSVPPEVLSTLFDGEQTVVSWREEVGSDTLLYRVEGSENGDRWNLLTDTSATTATVTPYPWIRVRTTDVRYGNSEPSDTYGGTGADVLVVDGFDRVLDGSYDQPTHDFAGAVGNAFGSFSVATNEAVAAGAVSLSSYPRVVWLLGDEGLVDVTFDDAEKDAIEAFLDGGGSLVVSGSEVGYATDPDWLAEVLHAEYVADDAGTTEVEGWTVGAEYVEDYPDVLDGDAILWEWATGGAAAVGYDRRIVVVGFGIENLEEDDLLEAATLLDDWLE